MGYGLILPDFPHKFYEPGRRRKRKLLKESRTRLHRCQLQLSKCCGEARKRIHFPNNKLKYKLQEYREKYTKKKEITIPMKRTRITTNGVCVCVLNLLFPNFSSYSLFLRCPYREPFLQLFCVLAVSSFSCPGCLYPCIALSLLSPISFHHIGAADQTF